MPRLFIGIPVPEEYQTMVEKVSASLESRLDSKVRWTKPGNAHITLKFLGDVTPDQLTELITALSAIEFPCIFIRAGGCFAFPNLRKPRTLWMGVSKGARACAELAEAVAQAVSVLGFEKDDRPFKCHLTLGRLKKLAKDDWEDILNDVCEVWPGCKVSHFTLWESKLTSDGPIYSVVEDFPLQPIE